LLVKHQADAVNLLKSYADAVATSIGSPLDSWQTIAAACEGKNGEPACPAMISSVSGNHHGTLTGPDILDSLAKTFPRRPSTFVVVHAGSHSLKPRQAPRD
jgi:hypothetical protein